MPDGKSRLKEFICGLAAAAQLLSRAGENGFFIEYVCLATSIIDAQLRMGLILRSQIDNRNKVILDEYLFQKGSRPYFSEKDIYRKSLEKGIINKDSFDKLIKYYEERNKIIHRFIISEITTEQVLKIALRYEDMNRIIRNDIARLENEQIEKGVGMTILIQDKSDKEVIEEINKLADEKHASKLLSHAIKKPPKDDPPPNP